MRHTLLGTNLLPPQAPAAGATALPPLRATWASAGQAVACGLNNQGNTCYMNSVLQCLAHLPPLANLCLERRHSSAGCRLRSSDAPCACCMVEAQISRMLNRGGCGGADTPHALYNSLRAFSKTFVPRRQEDAHELLRCLVDAMERDLLRNEGRYDPRKPLKVGDPPLTQGCEIYHGSHCAGHPQDRVG